MTSTSPTLTRPRSLSRSLLLLAALAGMASSAPACDTSASPGPATDTDSADTPGETPAGGELLLDAPTDTVALDLEIVVGFEANGTTDDIAGITFDPEGVFDFSADPPWEGIGLVALAEGETTMTVTNTDDVSVSAQLRAGAIATVTVLATTDAARFAEAVVTDIAPDGIALASGATVTYGARAHDAEGRDMVVDYSGLWSVVAGEDLVDVSYPQENWIMVTSLGLDGEVELHCGDAVVEVTTTSVPVAAELRVFSLTEAAKVFQPLDPAALTPIADIVVPRDKPWILAASRYDDMGRLLLEPEVAWDWSIADSQGARSAGVPRPLFSDGYEAGRRCGSSQV